MAAAVVQTLALWLLRIADCSYRHWWLQRVLLVAAESCRKLHCCR